MLTRKQHQLLTFIDEILQRTGVPPSYDEMKEALELKSKSGIHRILSALEERGHIRKLNNRARAIEVLKFPKNKTDLNNNSVAIPILGKIAAGHPIEAISDDTNYIDIPQSLLGKGEYFLLEVEGDSMINAGIFDGDQVIIEKRNDAKNGEIVVALIDNNEATLKRIYKRGQQLALQPENPAFKTVIYGPDRVQIQGILKKLIRKY